MSFSFGTSGAVPNGLTGPATNSQSQLTVGTTPAAKALNSAITPTPKYNLGVQTSVPNSAMNTQSTTPATSTSVHDLGVQAGLIPKSTTQNNVDGSSSIVTYHPPAPQTGYVPGPDQVIASQTPAANGQQGIMSPTYNPNAAPGAAGSVDPTLGQTPPSTSPNSDSTVPTGVAPGMLGTGSASSIANNQNPNGLLGNLIGQSQTLYNQENALNTPYIQQNQDTIAKATAEIQALQGGSFNGTGQDYIGRTGQLQNVIAQAQANINAAQQNLGTFSSQAQSALGTGLTAATTGANVTPPPGSVTTNALTGAQYSNDIYEPIGQYEALNPQPKGTPGQTPLAGQASQYTIKSGDTLNAIAAANGISESDLQTANPNALANDLQIGSNLVIPVKQNSAFAGGIVSGQAAAGANIVPMQTALAQARGIQAKIGTLLQQQPSLNQSPLAAANAIQQWAQSTQAPTGPYVSLLQDLQEYANTIAPVLGVGGTATDLKTSIATQLVPTLASGGTIQQALANLDNVAVGKINDAIKAGQNPSAPAQQQASATTNSSSGTPSPWH